MLSEGKYQGRLAGASTGSSSKGTPYLMLELQIVSVQHGADFVQMEPVDRKMYLYLSEAAKPYTYDTLKMLKFNGDFDNPGFPTDGQPIVLACKHRSYEGQEKEDWNIFAGVSLASSETQRLSEEFSKFNGTPMPPAKAPAPESPDGFVPADVELDHGPPDPNEVDVDDIPF